MEEKIIQFANELGIDSVGFAKYNDNSYIVCLFPYFTKAVDNNISIYAFSKDYHVIVKEKLETLAKKISNNYSIQVDIGENIERRLAYLAGLGFIGKNQMLINPKHGSFCFIGYIKIDLDLKPSIPLAMTCNNCKKCETVCPGKAISSKGFNIERCASAISQKKGELTQDEKEILIKSGLCFGCDICQLVCPHNDIKHFPMIEFKDDLITNIDLSIKDLSNKEFFVKYSNRAFSWRGKGVLVRNLKILQRINV